MYQWDIFESSMDHSEFGQSLVCIYLLNLHCISDLCVVCLVCGVQLVEFHIEHHF